MKWLKWTTAILVAIILLGLGAGYWLVNDRPSMQPYAGMLMAATPLTPGEVRVKFLGVATLLIEDGETAILTDGFFSRPGVMRMALGKIEPDLRAIGQGLERAGITRLAAVIPVHSHYDHAMDAPEVARRTGAMLIGSESTANVARGWGLPESQIRAAITGEAMQFGRFSVTLLPSRHAPTGFTGGEITSPLKPPARVTDYLEGASYAVLIRHGDKSFLINGSAGFEPGALKDIRTDVVMLGVGGLGSFEPSHEQNYWNEVVNNTGAKRVIAIHWDDFMTVAAGAPLTPSTLIGDFDYMMAFLKTNGENDGVDVRLPLDWQPMNIWDGLN